MKSILFVTGSMARGGAERVISILSDHYASNGWNTKILMLLHDRIEYEVHKDIEIVDFSRSKKSKFNTLRLIKETRNYIKKLNPDVVVAFMGQISLVTWAACIGLKTKLIVSERIDPSQVNRNFIIRKFINRAYSKSDLTVLQTKRAWNYFPKKVQKNSVIIGNPISVKAYAKDTYEKRFVTAGRLTNQKNHKMLINAFKSIHDKYPEYSLTIYGDGPLRDELTKQIAELGLNRAVNLPGNVPDIHEQISDSYAFVLSSDFEGLSNALLEAMMMGLPCISTNCAGSDEVIENNKNGLIVPCADTEALTNAMLSLVENSDFRNSIASEAKKSAEKFKTENIIEEWKKAIEG